MKDYRERIKSRAEMLKFRLDEAQLEELNKWVNDAITNGVDERSALDYVYIDLKKQTKVIKESITEIRSDFTCRKCGSDNIHERNGYKVCFDCGEHH